MRLLMLGGTGFVGRHITEAALDAGHEVTLFNRGKTNAEVFPGVTRLVGDREAGDLAALSTGEWDAVVDVNAYVPRRVREAVAALDGRVGHYTFISTVSVYEAKPSGPLVEDESPVGVLDDPTTENVDGRTYGPLKVLCEAEAQAAFPGHCTVIRPGIVAGPWDPTERFTHWVRAGAAGGVVRAPARPDQPVQVVHARDQGDFVVKASSEGLDGVFNTVGPSSPLTFASMLAACASAAGTTIDIEWVDEAAAASEKLPAPLYLPSAAGIDGLFEASSAKAEAAGFRNRPIVETAADTLAWAIQSG
jgi:2'-hydroxyisoflavone reductase